MSDNTRAIEAEANALHGYRDRTIALLTRIQWAGTSVSDEYTPVCPDCRVEEDGRCMTAIDWKPLPPGTHAADCELARLAGLPRAEA